VSAKNANDANSSTLAYGFSLASFAFFADKYFCQLMLPPEIQDAELSLDYYS
jgi:hypothetical protein